jgi:hypothetical protein
MSNAIVLRFIEAFDALGIPYMLVGSYSSNLYGRPRATADADFVLQITGDPIPELARRLGSDYRIDPQMSFETVTSTMRYVATHPATAFKIEMFLLSDDAHDQSRFQRRRRLNFEGVEVSLPTPEDVVITKLRWSLAGQRHKDVEDVRNVLDLMHSQLDLAYIRQWCDRHGTRELFERLLEESSDQGS